MGQSESTARGQRYCSKECCDKAQELNKKLKKKRQSRRAYQKDNYLATTLLVQTYTMARKVAEVFLEKVCVECGSLEDLEVHHIDLNPFNNTPSNIEYRCKSCHTKQHTRLPKISMVDIINNSLSEGAFWRSFLRFYKEALDKDNDLENVV